MRRELGWWALPAWLAPHLLLIGLTIYMDVAGRVLTPWR